MRLTFKKWLETGNVVEIPPQLPGDLPFPTSNRYPKKNKDTGPGRRSDAGQTNAIGDFHSPDSEELPPVPGVNEPKRMNKRSKLTLGKH